MFTSFNKIKELQQCLLDLIEADGIDDESQDWEKLLDRDSLKHSSFKTFNIIVIAAMENVVQVILHQISEEEKGDVKTEAISVDKDVTYSWHVLASDWQPEKLSCCLP